MMFDTVPTTSGTDRVTEFESKSDGTEVASGTKIGSTGLPVGAGDLTPGAATLMTPGVTVVHTVSDGNFAGRPTRTVTGAVMITTCRSSPKTGHM